MPSVSYTSGRLQIQVQLVSRRVRHIIVVAGLVLSTAIMLAACGQKGPLYLPEEEPEKKKEPQDQSFIGMPRRPA